MTREELKDHLENECGFIEVSCVKCNVGKKRRHFGSHCAKECLFELCKADIRIDQDIQRMEETIEQAKTGRRPPIR